MMSVSHDPLPADLFDPLPQAENEVESSAIAYVEAPDEVVQLDVSATLLNLSKQQRNLLLLRPLFQLELYKLRIGTESKGDQGLFVGIDTHYLVLSALDFMMEGTTLNMGCRQQEVLEHLAAVTKAMKSDLTEAQSLRIAETVLDTLDNKAGAFREFSFDMFDATRKTTISVKFRLVTYEPDLEDVYRYRPTPEGYLVYLGMLDLSPEDSQELMEKMLDMLVQRGRFEAALEIARRARKLSIEYRQFIRDRLLQAYRAPGSVNWTKEMAGKLSVARLHVRGRQNEDQRMEEAVRDALITADEPQTRQNLSHLLKTLQSASFLRSMLVNDITVAPEKFLEAQRAVFRARRQSGLPDLEARIFPQLLGLSADVLAGNADDTISSFYPPAWPKVYDLNSAFALLLEKRGEDAEPQDDDGEITRYSPPPDQFSKELILFVEQWLKMRFNSGNSYRIDELLGMAKAEGLNSQVRRCMILMLFKSFAQSESEFSNMRADVLGLFYLDVAQGANLQFSPNGEEP
jgi:hypothetical protein